MMAINVGRADQMVRVVTGLTLMTLAATGVIGVWGWIGVVPLLTGLSRRCPAYMPFVGLSTCARKGKTP